MNSDMPRNDGLEPVDTPIQTIKVGPFELAPEFEHLRDAPVGEFETCNTVAAE